MIKTMMTSQNQTFIGVRKKELGMPRVYFANIDIDLERESQVYKDNPGAVGANVDCIVPGKNKSEAIALLKDALNQDGYTLYKINEFGNFLNYYWDNEERRMEYYAYAWKAHVDSIISYGLFFAYDQRDSDQPSTKCTGFSR
jgi:hypothetical protein